MCRNASSCRFRFEHFTICEINLHKTNHKPLRKKKRGHKTKKNNVRIELLGRLAVTGLRGRSQSQLQMCARGLGSQLKDSIPVTGLSASGPFESHDLLQKGFSCVKNELLPSHPLESSEKNFQLNQDEMNFSTLRNIQGLFAPLKLQMEFKAVQQVQRLPFLPSANLSLDILRGNDETIGFGDILNDPPQSELMREPHWMVEYKLGLP
ncbi:proteasome maturation protein-like [Rhinolophus ferrumequinum]|uniref:proteasome maturation protein-like n=1 Tax=Rhinolophus ferrumequinum TaxID=59479 RepID=UPI00140F981D|nr:proteasome maturation protein-like [Rhinolophus ferrumequinum]